MPLLASLLLFGGLPSPASIFQASVAAHARLQRADVLLSTETRVGDTDLRSRMHLRFIQPDRLALRVQEPQQQGKAASDRTYALIGNNFTGVDFDAAETTQRAFPFPSALALPDRLSLALGDYGDAVEMLLRNSKLQSFFANYQNLNGFRVFSRGGVVELDRTLGRIRAVFDFGQSDHLLRKVRLESPGNLLLWTFVYGTPPSSLSVPNTGGMRKVDALTVRATPPKYASPQARSLARRSEFAYNRLRSVVCHFSGSEGAGTFWVGEGSFRQDWDQSAWTYRGRVLTARIDAREFQSRVAPTRVSSALQRVGISVQPMLLQIVQGRNPMGTLLATESKVRVAGSLVSAGAKCAILEIKARGITVSTMVRQADGMILSTRSTILGRRGEVAIREERDYRYEGVNRPLSGTTFNLPVSSPRPFPK